MTAIEPTSASWSQSFHFYPILGDSPNSAQLKPTTGQPHIDLRESMRETEAACPTSAPQRRHAVFSLGRSSFGLLIGCVCEQDQGQPFKRLHGLNSPEGVEHRTYS